MSTEIYQFTPIAYVHSDAKFRCDAPRQSVFSGTGSILEFVSDTRFELALADLRGFDRIWIIFCFHLNVSAEWHAKVRPPVSSDGKRYGVFATRSPHRPNPIGLSCVELLEVGKGMLRIGANDLLDETPVLDIKPYLPEADAFPDVSVGWKSAPLEEPWTLQYSEPFLLRAEWLLSVTRLDVRRFCEIQLERNPLDKRRKRITMLEEETHRFAIGYRTWQVVFRLDSDTRMITLETLLSHYREDELVPGAEDRYGDKDVHRLFRQRFGEAERLTPPAG